MKSYLKFLSRNMLYTAIEAVGLIVSLAFVILIGSYVHHQWRVSKGAPEWDHYYALGTVMYDNVEMAPDGLAWMIKENLPGVEHAAMISYRGFEPQLDEETLRDEHITRVEPDFFEMFPVEWVEGDVSSMTPGTVAVNERIVNKFGQNLIGRQLSSYGDTLVVSAVFRSFGGSLFRQTGFLRVQEQKTLSPGSNGGTTCLIDSSLPEEELVRNLDQVLQTYHPKTWGRDESRTFKNGCIERLDRLYYSSVNSGGDSFHKGNSSQLHMLVAVVLLLLLSAVFNYINLNAALAGKRTKEMGIRTILGASRGKVIWKYLAESLLFISVCTLLACLLAQVMAPRLCHYLEMKQWGDIVSAPFSLRWDIPTIAAIVLLVVVVGLLAGWIPARLSGRFNPIQVVKGDYRFRSKRVFSKLFIVFQTALSVLLIAFSLVMERQFSHMIHRPVAADIENMYVQQRLTDAQVDELAGLPFIKEMGLAGGYPGYRQMLVSMPWRNEEETINYSMTSMDPAAFRMCGFEIVEDYHTQQGLGVWLSETTRNGLEMEPGQTTIPKGADVFGIPLAGILRDFAVTDAAHVESNEWGVIMVQEESEVRNIRGNFRYALLRIDGDRKAAKERLEAVYRKYSIEQFGVERWTEYNGFVDDQLKKGLEEAEKYMRLMELFMGLAVLVSLLGLLAMSSFYASEKTHDVAVRKVFGGTVGGEVMRGVGMYMLLVAIACVMAVPVAVWMAGRYLEGFNYRISGYGWIFAVAVVITLVISFLAVLWQTLKAAKTNPAVELKKE